MKFTIHNNGQEIQVGEYILVKPMIADGYCAYKVHRVTPKFAYIMWNDTSEAKFPRIFIRSCGFCPRAEAKDRFKTTEYIACKEKVS